MRWITKTSVSDPLYIAAVSPPDLPGVIGMTLCPGKKDPGRAWDRDLDTDPRCHPRMGCRWCSDRSDEFAQAVLLAANLGEDADTVAAVTGHIAGALWGLTGIPRDWLDRLAWRERLENMARLLTAAR